MTRETRIGLLVGLGFIILFGLILGLLNDTSDPPKPVQLDEDNAFSYWTQVKQIPRVSEARAEQTGARPRPVVRTSLRPANPDGGPPVAVAKMRQQAPLVMRASRPPVASDRTAHEPAAVKPTAEPPKVRTHTVEPYDSLYRIAERFYGDGNKYRRIFEANRNVLADEDTLSIGQVLVIPDVPGPTKRRGPARLGPTADRQGPTQAGQRALAMDELPGYFKQLRRNAAAKRYVVQDGDNLTAIARRFLSDDSPAAVQKIFSANRGRLGLDNPDELPVGVELLIPGQG